MNISVFNQRAFLLRNANAPGSAGWKRRQEIDKDKGRPCRLLTTDESAGPLDTQMDCTKQPQGSREGRGRQQRWTGQGLYEHFCDESAFL